MSEALGAEIDLVVRRNASKLAIGRNEFTIVLPRTNLIPAALDLLQRHSLSYWDALLIAACIEAGVDTLYSEDLSTGVAYDSVKVVNPFI